MSLLVDGVNQSGNLGTGVNFNGSLDTGSAWSWFKVMTVTDARIFNKSVGLNNADQTIKIGISTAASGTVSAILGQTEVTAGSTTIALNIWHLMVATYDGANVRGYFNGVLFDTTAKTGNLTTNARNTRIGTSGHDTTARAFDGHVADVGISDETFSQDFITTMYHRRGALFIPNRHRWPLNDDAPGVTVGASIIHDIGPQSLAPGSGTNSPTFEDQELVFGQAAA